MVKKSISIYRITLAAVLSAIGIVIPLVSPLKIILEPASFTLASHVAIFVAMFVSPGTAVAVSLVTALGFLLSGAFSMVVVLRAASHIFFAFFGAWALRKYPKIMQSVKLSALWIIAVSFLHAFAELVVVTPFYVTGSALLKPQSYTDGYFVSIFLLVGVGSFVHSIVDYFIALPIWRAVKGLARR